MRGWNGRHCSRWAGGGCMAEETKAVGSGTEEDNTILPELVSHTIKRHAAYAAAGGLIPIPLVEVAASGTIQLRMIARLCDHYDLPFSEQARSEERRVGKEGTRRWGTERQERR